MSQLIAFTVNATIGDAAASINILATSSADAIVRAIELFAPGEGALPAMRVSATPMKGAKNG